MIHETTPTDVRGESWRNRAAGVLFATIVVLMTIDVIEDLGTGATPLHLATEVAVALLAAAGVVLLWRGMLLSRARQQTAERRAEALGREVAALDAEARRWREEARDALEGLAAAIDRQFERWELTPAEREVALLLLKGLSHKEVADVRGTSPLTARQQALTVYRKAGVGGRSELAAFFLEDLLLPAKPEP